MPEKWGANKLVVRQGHTCREGYYVILRYLDIARANKVFGISTMERAKMTRSNLLCERNARVDLQSVPFRRRDLTQVGPHTYSALSPRGRVPSVALAV